MLRGRGIPLVENKTVSKFQSFLVSCFLGFLVSWLLGFVVSKSQRVERSKIISCLLADIDPILSKFHFVLSERN